MSRGKRIADRYELRTPIGHGAMGEVWESTDLRLNRPVAVKFIRPDLLDSEDGRRRLVRRFRREAAALAGIDHPNVASVHDASEWEGLPYLVMQLVPGMATLADVVEERGPFTVTEAAAAGAQIAAGLSATHAARLVHRDLKPQNVMIAPHGSVKIVDFGLVAPLDAGPTRLTAAGEDIGTPDYRAPEQSGGPHAVVDHRADLYSLGCLLHFMLTASRPFTAPTAALVLLAHREQPPSPLGSFRDDVVPPDLESLVLQLLAKCPEDRPDDAASVYVHLAPHLPAPAPQALRAPASGQEMDVTRPFQFPASPLLPVGICDSGSTSGAEGRR
ncbi:serine/threonine-protein kinase [Streptomyces antimycoticus]|uniref:serine/threonine-protein kinase n=1 Tax=Streptomyces antimycoticus TaxID=68175 RepID=UPI0034081D61